MFRFPSLLEIIVGWILKKIYRCYESLPGMSGGIEYYTIDGPDELGYFVVPVPTVPEFVNTVEDFQQWLDDLQFMNEQ